MLGGGAGPAWREALARRAGAALEELAGVGPLVAREGPESLRPYELERSVGLILSLPPEPRQALALHPALDCWLDITRSFRSASRPARDWEAHFPFLQCFAAAAAVLAKATVRLEARLSAQARFHLTGTRQSFEFPAAEAGTAAVCEVSAGRALVRSAAGTPGTLRELAAVTETLWVEPGDPLVLQPVVMHGVRREDAREQERFRSVLAGAMARIRELDAPLHAELASFLRLIVPLENPAGHRSVSSSYRNLRGALCLSHSEDSLLQEETLIHEFCHQKVNLLLESDPLLEPGQGGQVFFSPLRPDARRLSGLLLGAHAFVNVNRYLLRALRAGGLPAEAAGYARRTVAARLFHVEEMLRSVCGYADLTELGRSFLLRLWREHMLCWHESAGLPPALLEKGRAAVAEKRARYALGGTGLHSGAAPEAALKASEAALARDSARSPAKRGKR